MNTEYLQNLRDEIEKMEPIHQLRIFEIIKNKKLSYTENNNGIFINLTTVDEETIKDIKSYLLYVDLQQEQLDKGEQDKEKYINQFYKDNKDIVESETQV
jgi:hypothetical protein|tara:strand:- start:6413 stop:6712 length:300 start_codon:yes stop_codon:yes gene_type:complete